MKKHLNARQVLPEALVQEIQKYVQGAHLYIPSAERKAWGASSGTRDALERRNMEIVHAYRGGQSIARLSEMFCLSEERIRAIVYGRSSAGADE
jgi:Mor family transcriptional regulator